MRGRLIACAMLALVVTTSTPAAPAQAPGPDCGIRLHPDVTLALCASPHGAHVIAGVTSEGTHAAANVTHSAFMASFGGPRADAGLVLTGTDGEHARAGIVLVAPTIENEGGIVACAHPGSAEWCATLWGGYGRAAPLAP